MPVDWLIFWYISISLGEYTLISGYAVTVTASPVQLALDFLPIFQPQP